MHRFHATLFSALFATSAAFASSGEEFPLFSLLDETELNLLRTNNPGASDAALHQALVDQMTREQTQGLEAIYTSRTSLPPVTPPAHTAAPAQDVPSDIPPAPAPPLSLPSAASISALPASASLTFEQEIANRARSNANEHAVEVDILNTPAFRVWLEASGMAGEWDDLPESSRLMMAEIYRGSL